MKIFKIICFTLLIPLGGFLVVFGEMDDSPGAQGLGLILTLIGIIGLYRLYRSI